MDHQFDDPPEQLDDTGLFAAGSNSNSADARPTTPDDPFSLKAS
jgi:hypothetical protein